MTESLYKSADQLLQQGELEQALALFREVCRANPHDVNSWLKCAAINGRLKRFDDVIKCCQRAIQISPASHTAMLNIARAHAETGNIPEARAAYSRVIDMLPGNLAAHLGLARVSVSQNRPDQAASQYIKVCELSPGNIEARTFLGKFYRDAGHIDKAIIHFSSGVDAHPDNISLLFLLASSYAIARKHELAKSVCDKILSLNPEQFETYMLLGRMLHLEKRHNEACKMFTSASSLQPQRAEPHFRIGESLSRLGDCDGACASFRKAIELDPDFEDAYTELSIAYNNSGLFNAAIDSLERALRINPKSAMAYNNLALILQERNGDNPDSVQYYKKAIELDPGLAAPYANLGNFYTQCGDYEKSIELYRKARTINPEMHAAHAGEAAAMERLGDGESAFKLIEPLINAGSRDIKIALIYSRLVRYHGRIKYAIELLHRAMETPGIKPPDLVEANFSLGFLYDQSSDYERAFEYYRTANNLKGIKFDARDCETTITRIRSVFSEDFLKSSPHAGRETDSPIFIIGMSRSGTSLVEQILSSHPDVFGAGELTAILDLSTRLPSFLNTKEPFPECMAMISPADLDSLAERHMTMLNGLSDGATRVTDKMPSNYMFLGLIQLLFPNARIIHCNRDPLDTCLSCYFQNFLEGHTYTYKLEDLGFYYRQYRLIMDHWRNVLSVPILELQYEDLITDTEEVVRGILEFCDLKWHPECLKPHTSDRIVQTASYDQVRRPIYTSSIARWKHYERSIEPLKKAIGDDYLEGR